MSLAIKSTFKWADELDGIQDVIGGTNKQAAAFNFTLRKSGVSADTFTRGLVILGKGLIKADGSLDATGKSLKAWGIDVLDVNGVLKDQGALVGEISDKYNTFATQQEKVNFLTEVFGKSGASLIDFFDTLAADGGIDKVAEKVERLGLAIDPNRYEQFNRNLEELKLVGLAMAVGFTEKVMPAIEGFLELVSDPNLTLSGFAKKADDFIGGLIDGLATSVDTWVSGGGPEELSERIVSWVENLGEGEGVQSKILLGAQSLVTAIATALTEIDWAAIGTAIDTKLDEAFAVMDPAIRKSLDGIDATFNEWLAGKPVAWMDNLDTTLNEGTKKALGNAGMNFSNWAAGVNATVDTWAAGIQEKFQTWAAGVIATYNTWAADVNSRVNAALNTLKSTIENKLTDMAKMFFNRAAGWGNQMLQGFIGSQGALFSSIASMVQEINGLLRQIITSFHLSLTFSEPTNSSVGGGNRPRPGSGGTTGGNSNSTPRASGGPVIGGQSYSVAEFFRPERFTPNTSGRMDPLKQGGTQSVMITNWNGFNYAELASHIIKSMNNA